MTRTPSRCDPPVAIRVYPKSCASAFCGRSKCTGCASFPELEAFRRWVAKTAAVECDRVWSPGVYRATVIS